jgi:hypothetical protein
MRRALVSTVGPLAIYTLVSLVFFGRVLVLHGDRAYIGKDHDPEIFIWSLAWWPHAILHGENPFVTHAIWPVTGLNLAWVTSVPGLAILAAPVTLVAGPVIAYNVASVVLPALAAWTAFLLCRHVTGSWWPSLAGGYLFGFSSYMLGHTLGHLNLTSVFLVPLVALAVLRYIDGTASRRAFATSLGLLLGAQLSLSTEVFATLTVALATSLATAFIVLPSARRRLRSAVPAVLAAYVLGAIVAAPLLGYALTDFQTNPINDPALHPVDVLNFLVPTKVTLVNTGYSRALSGHFLGALQEQGAYLGLPLVAILVLFAWEWRRRSAGRYLVTLLALGVVAELGLALYVAGHRIMPMPWALAARLPGLVHVIPGRFSMYVSLAAAVAAALWATSPQPRLSVRVGLLAAAVVALVPAFPGGLWQTTPTRPSFFTSGTYRACLLPNETVFIPDADGIDATLWQAETPFRFRLANGFLGLPPPNGIPDRDAALAVELDDVPGSGQRVVRLARELGATTILVDAEHRERWAPVLGAAGLRPVAKGASGCTSSVPTFLRAVVSRTHASHDEKLRSEVVTHRPHPSGSPGARGSTRTLDGPLLGLSSGARVDGRRATHALPLVA